MLGNDVDETKKVITARGAFILALRTAFIIITVIVASLLYLRDINRDPQIKLTFSEREALDTPFIYVCSTNEGNLPITLSSIKIEVWNVQTYEMDKVLSAQLNQAVKPYPVSSVKNKELWSINSCFSISPTGTAKVFTKQVRRNIVIKMATQNPPLKDTTYFFLLGLATNENKMDSVIPYPFQYPSECFFSYETIEQVFKKNVQSTLEFVRQGCAAITPTDQYPARITINPEAYNTRIQRIEEKPFNYWTLLVQVGGILEIILMVYSWLFGKLRLCTWGAMHVTLNYFYSQSKSGSDSKGSPPPPVKSNPIPFETSSTTIGEDTIFIDQEQRHQDLLHRVDMEITRRLKDAERKIAKEYIVGFDLNLPQGDSSALQKVRMGDITVDSGTE